MDFAKIFNHIPETIVVLSPDYVVLAATAEYLQATLRSHDELIGQNFLHAFPDNPNNTASKNEKLLRTSLDKVLETKEVDYLDVLRYDIPKPKEQGGGFDIRYWEASHTPVLNDAGEVIYIIQRTIDVTEREIAKLALSESEDKFRFMAEAMPQLISTANAAGDATYFNQRWTAYTGLPVKELIDAGLKKVAHPEDLEMLMDRWASSFKNNTDFQAEMRIRAKDGSYRWHLHRSVPMQDESGKVMMWVGSATDIHDTRQLVQELLQTNEQMSSLSDQVQHAYQKAETERQTLERLIMTSPIFFCTLKGRDYRFELVNEKYQQIFPGRELVGKRLTEAIPEVREQGFLELLDQVYTTGKELIAENVLFRVDKTNTGNLEDIHVTFTYQPMYDAGEITGILVCGYEMTEVFKLKQQLQELNYGTQQQ
ncbi:PAS domain-containing protein [Pontibacter harenae]|uniref:PAS domain-containing protein n=1 Tax=Pontibacter harenae TaxID=2894083 RepID=UPI001E430887|nr:PAS domain-containing protein [Pontibacter harenae]MCC9165539.1 PAS domain-containing protein [Pontibacter harenae]